MSSEVSSEASPRGYVLGVEEGEHLVRSGAAANPGDGKALASGGSVCIKADPRTGSHGMSLGTQHVPQGVGIRVHRHHATDEVLYILEGRGIGILGDTRMPIQKGSTIFIPKGTWHGIENPDGALELLWVVTPPGLEALFRAIGSAPGAPAKQFSLAELNEVARSHAQEFR
jgi:mannose-6-phosphate isomerase-like protein (cupin superfamily)